MRRIILAQQKTVPEVTTSEVVRHKLYVSVNNRGHRELLIPLMIREKDQQFEKSYHWMDLTLQSEGAGREGETRGVSYIDFNCKSGFCSSELGVMKMVEDKAQNSTIYEFEDMNDLVNHWRDIKYLKSPEEEIADGCNHGHG